MKAILLLILIISVQSYACEQVNESETPVLIFPPKFDSLSPENDYVFQLLELILKKTNEKYGLCKAKLLEQSLPLKRLELYLEKNISIHVASLTVSNERDQKLLPIKIPISKGLMGYRLLMIHKKDINKFSYVNDIADLSPYLAGQGDDWADVDILKSNNLQVITTGSIQTLIEMLAYQRFDYFPRGSLQITTELNTYKDKPVMVEPHLVLRYPSMTALYVNADNIALWERLNYGLNKAYADGSFDTFFNNHPSSVQALKKLELQKRKILDMCNPILPRWVPIHKSEYWLEPWSDKILNKNCQLKQAPHKTINK